MWLCPPHRRCCPPTQIRPVAPARPADIGDMFDVSTSPNEPLMFPIHHANLDRSNMLWQMKALQQDRTMLSKFW